VLQEGVERLCVLCAFLRLSSPVVTRHIILPFDVAAIIGWFTEGFDTPDLQEAKALLEELA